jgi:hypothetical protein
MEITAVATRRRQLQLALAREQPATGAAAADAEQINALVRELAACFMRLARADHIRNAVRICLETYDRFALPVFVLHPFIRRNWASINTENYAVDRDYKAAHFICLKYYGVPAQD